MSILKAFRGAALLLSMAAAVEGCTPSGTDTFVREEQTVAVSFNLLTGSARTDLWSVTRVSVNGVDTDTLVHSKGGTRWDAFMLPELEGSSIQSLAAAAKNEVWVSTLKSRTTPGLWLVTANGSIEDHSSELPAGATQALELTFAGGTLFATQTGTNAAPLGHIFRRTATGLEELPGLEPTVQFTLLAARGPNDLYLDQSLANFSGAKIVHYLNGVATEIPYPSRNQGLPTVKLSATGEIWFWKDGSPTELSGLHGEGSNLTAWSSVWPAVTDKQQVQHRAAGMYPSGPGKLAFLDQRTDLSAEKETERASLGVNHIDAQGKLTEGPRLLQCLSVQECAVGQGAFLVLGDGVVIISANTENMGTLWFTGPVSSLQ